MVDLLGSESDEFASDILAQHRLKNFIVGHNFVLVDAQITSGPYNSRRKLYAIPFDLSSPPQNITGDNHLKSSFDGALSEDSNHFVFTEKDAVGAYSTYKLSLLDLSKTLLNRHNGSEIKQLKLNSSEVALVGVDTTVATRVNLETGASTTLGNNETISGCVDEAGETNFITTKTKGVYIYSCENFKGAKLYTLSAQDQTPREILYIKNPEYKEGDTLGYYSFRNIEYLPISNKFVGEFGAYSNYLYPQFGLNSYHFSISPDGSDYNTYHSFSPSANDDNDYYSEVKLDNEGKIRSTKRKVTNPVIGESTRVVSEYNLITKESRCILPNLTRPSKVPQNCLRPSNELLSIVHIDPNEVIFIVKGDYSTRVSLMDFDTYSVKNLLIFKDASTGSDTWQSGVLSPSSNRVVYSIAPSQFSLQKLFSLNIDRENEFCFPVPAKNGKMANACI